MSEKKQRSKKYPESTTATEILQLLNKQWASNSDLMKIGGVGINKAIADRKEIAEKIKQKYGEDCRLPAFKVPMNEVVSYYNIDIGYLRKISQINNK